MRYSLKCFLNPSEDISLVGEGIIEPGIVLGGQLAFLLDSEPTYGGELRKGLLNNLHT